MNRIHPYGVALAIVTLFSASAAQAQTVVSHKSDYAFDGMNAQVDAYDTYSSPTAVTFSPQVSLYGDPATFTWDGSGALTVSNVTTNANTGLATLAITGSGNALNPLIGFSHYSYSSAVGQGLFNVSTVGGNLRLALATSPPDLAGPFTPYTLNAIFLGNWSIDGTGPLQIDANSFAVTSNFTVTRNFLYDPTFDATFFSATAVVKGQSAFVPEPGSFALLGGMMASTGVFVLRRRRRS